MDKAFWDTMHWDNFRWDTFNPIWDNKVLPTFKRLGPRNMGGKTACVQGSARQGQTRHKVFIPLFDEVIQKFKKGT